MSSDLGELADRIVSTAVAPGAEARHVVTANLDHVVNLSANPAFRAAYDRAWAVTADGMPVYLYARMRGVPLKARVTGADLCGVVLKRLDPERHRCYFVAGSQATAEGVKSALRLRGFDGLALDVCVPPLGFEHDEVFSSRLAANIAGHGTTHLFFAVGSPKSEIWIDRHRTQIGPCYALSIGAGLDFFSGTKARAPRFLQQAGLEWAWRLACEPRRLARRYLIASWRFLYLVWADLRS